MAKACHVLCLAVFGTGQLFVPWTCPWTVARVARVAPRALAEPDIDKWLQTLEGTEGWPKDQLLLLRTRLRQQRRYRLADALLELLRPRLEAAELWVEDDQGGTRLVPHRGASAARRSARAARAAKAARQGAVGALQRSLKAENVEEAVAAAAAAACGVRRALKEDIEAALKGRQASDLALSLALAGCEDREIFASLAQISQKELLARQRSLVSVQQTVERLATAGYRQQDFPGLFKAGEAALKRLGCPQSSNLRDLQMGNYSLHSPRPLLWLFRHATRQGRRCIPPTSSKVHEAVVRLSQSGKPLVIDLGCGFGASSLGLTQHGFAVLAVDASAHCIRYATALARRWQLPESCASFVQCGAEEALAAAQSVADIDVKWILINFPTPFAVQSDRAGLSCSKRYLMMLCFKITQAIKELV
ncbi:unnamed protein product [Cladocopium goreaui]|uniref:Methyltransferase domain-containing protein n=1 Tax=Cladocopium goreaui TaxID=2562237 RepID=A0A9P1FGV2_9DINO|nr:unnamed protein product [Cladocopium goreaui]